MVFQFFSSCHDLGLKFCVNISLQSVLHVLPILFSGINKGTSQISFSAGEIHKYVYKHVRGLKFIFTSILFSTNLNLMYDKHFDVNEKNVVPILFWPVPVRTHKTIQAVYVCGKSNNHYIFWVCVYSLRYPACNAHAPCCNQWPARLYNIFFPRYLIKGTISGKMFLNTKCVFWFSLQLLSENFVLPNRIERDMIKMYNGLHAKYPLFSSDLNEINFRETVKYQISWKSVQCEPSWSMQTDGRMDRQDEATSSFSQFCERA
jgi:hypothetical protein